jgi:hypothetical protein
MPAEYRFFQEDKLYRFNDLQEMGFVANWPTLKNWQDRFDFPLGRRLGRTRTWTGRELNDWYHAQPQERVINGRCWPDRPRKSAVEQSAAG